MVHRGGIETSSEQNKKDDFNTCLAEEAKTADDETYVDHIEELATKAKQTKGTAKKASLKSTALPLSDHSISQTVVRVERSRFIKKKNHPNSKPENSAKSVCISPVRAGLRSNSLESHTSTTSNNNNAKGKQKKVNKRKGNPKPIDSPPQETVNPISDDSQTKLSEELPLTFICSLPLDRLSGILENLKIDKTLTKCPPSNEEETSIEDKQNVDQNSSQCKTLCLYCDKRMSTVKVRARHIERFHTISKERRSSTRNPVTSSQDSKDSASSLTVCSSSSSPSTPKSSSNLLFSGCSFCCKALKLQAVALETDLNALFYHLVDLHSDKYFGCKLCAIRFQNAAKLDDHVQRTHTHTQPSKSKLPAEDVSSPLVPDEERSASEFGKSTPTKTRRQLKQTNAESAKPNAEVFSPPTKAGSSTSSSSVSRNGSMFSNDEPILSRLGVTQNRLPRGRKGIRSRRQTNVDGGVKPDNSLMNVKTRSKVGKVCTSNEPIETVFRTPTNTRTEPLSCTFDEDFYENVFINVRTNLGCHLDGKLGNELDSNCPQSPPPLLPAICSTVVKSPHIVESEVHTATSLAALTAFPTLLTAEQYGCDFGTAKIKRPITKHSWKWKWDSVKKYKYVNEGGKIVKKIKQPMLGLRDLSKLDMWTQLTMRQKHEVVRKQADATSESSREEKQKQVDQLNTILDSRRLPQIILEQNEQTIIKLEITDEGLRYLAGEMSAASTCEEPSTSLAVDRIVPANLNLIPSRSLGESLRHTVVLSGEWARPRCYVCFGCGARFEKLKALEEHKMFRHPHVYSTHYEIVGRELIEGNLYKHFFIPLKALSRHREYAQRMLVNKKTEDLVPKSSNNNSGNEEESLDSLHSVTASFTTLSSSKLSDDCDTDTKTALENVSSSSYTEPSTLSIKNDSGSMVVSSFSVHCTKCNRNCHGILELYRHMLDCSGDYAWLLAKKKKYRYYGSRKRRQFNKHSISTLHLHKRKLKENKDENESDATPKKKPANMSPSTPRPRPSDADSIRKMLENLPPKRVCREIIPNATKPRSRKFKTAAGRKMQQNAANKKCKSSNTTLTAISKKFLRNHKLRAISEKDKISRNNKLLENKRKSTRVNSAGLSANKKSQSTENTTNKKTDTVKGDIVRKIGATTKRFVKKIKKRLLGKKQSTNTTESTADDVEKTTVKKLSKLSAVRKLTFDKEKDACKNQADDSEEKSFIECKQTVSTIAEIDTHKDKSEKAEIQLSVCKDPVPTITIESECDWKKSQDAIVSESISLRSEGSMENLHQQQLELSTSTEDLGRFPSGFLQNQVSPTTKRRSKKINDCIAMLTGKLQEKLGKPFLECKETAGNGKPHISPEVSTGTVPASTENKDTKPPKRKALSRRIVKCDIPAETNAATPTTKPPVTEQSETKHPVTKSSVTNPAVPEPSIPEPPVSKPSVSEPLVLEPPVSEPRVTEPPVTKTPITKHAVAKASAVTKPPATTLPEIEPPLRNPLVEKPVVTERKVIEPVVTKHLDAKPLVAKPPAAKHLVIGPSIKDLPFAVPSHSGPALLQTTLTGYSVKEPPQTKAPSMEIAAALNQFISARTRKAPPPVVTVEITTPPHIEVSKKLLAERKQPPRQQSINNADIIRVPCIKPPQLTIPQFTPVQIPAPRGMITKRRQTIAGAPNDFLSEINSMRCANTYNNLPFELEVPLDLSKKSKRSSPKAKAGLKAFPPYHHPQISVKSNAVLMPPKPFPLPILPQTQIIPIRCDSLQPKVSQIPLQSPPLMFQNEHPKTNSSLPKKRANNNNKKQEAVMSTILSPPFINLTVDSPSPKKVPKKLTVTAERKLKSNVVPVPPPAKTATLIREPILILPFAHSIEGPQTNEKTANNVIVQPSTFEKTKEITPAIQSLGCDVDIVPAIQVQETAVKVPPLPTLDLTTETEIEKCVSIPEGSQAEELTEIKSPNEIKESNAIKEPNEIRKPNEIEEANETEKSNKSIKSNEIRETNEIRESKEIMESKNIVEPKEIMEPMEIVEPKEIMTSNEMKPKDHQDSKETKEPSRTNKKYSQAAPKKVSSSSAVSSTTNQSDKQLEAPTKIDKKPESSPESQKSFPTRRSRRNKMADQKAVANDVRPSALKVVEAIAASFLSEDEQENEDIMPIKSKPQPEEAQLTQAPKSENTKPDKKGKTNENDEKVLAGTKPEKPTINNKVSSADIEVVPVSDDKDKETPSQNNQDASKKPRRRRKNELAAIVADQLMESFKEVDKSRIDDLKRLENLAYEKSEDLLLTGMRLMPTTKRKNVLDNKREISTEQESKVPPVKEAKKQKAETAKEKKIQKQDGELFKEPKDAQKADVKVKNQKEDVEVVKLPNCKVDLKAKPLPIDFGNYRTNSVDSWSHRGPTQNSMALLSPENDKSPNSDVAFGVHKRNRKKQMKKRDKKIEIENINQLRTGLESFTLSKGVADNVKEDAPAFCRTLEPAMSIVGLFTPTQRNPSSLTSGKESDASAFASLTAVKSSSSILRPSILAASLDIATNKDNASQSENRKSSISSRDPRLNKNIHTEEGDPAALPPETLSRLSTLRQRRKSVADITAPPQHTTRANSRSASTKRSEANSRRNSMAFDDDDDDNYLTAIAKRVNDKIMSAEDKDFNLANDGFDLANSFLDIDDPFGRPSTSMSVRSAPNFNEDRSNMDTMDATNTDLIDMDVDDDMSVYTTFSQDTSRSAKGRRRRRRRSVLLTRKPKKTNVNTMEPTETFVCLLCNKTFAKSAALNKHQLTIAHVTKLSEQEYLNATRKQEEAKQAPPVVSSSAKVTAKTKTTDKEAVESVKQSLATIPMVAHVASQKVAEIHEKPMEKVEKTPQPKLPYIPPNSILNQSGIEPISSPEQNYERYSTKTLNPDERLFYECCNILKGSETPQVERNYPIVPPTTYAYDLQIKPVTPKSTNERFSYIKQSTAETGGKRDGGAYPRLDINQFSDISSDSNPACAQPLPILPESYAQMHVLSAAKDQAVLPNDEGNGGALRSNIPRENPILQISSLVSPNPVAPLTARTFVNQPSQIGAHLYGMESAATVTQKQNFISPLHSASSQSSTITTTTCRLKTKAAMKGYDNLKVSIPTIGLDMEHALERSPRAGCKLTTLAEIALGNETPMTAITSFTPAMQMHNEQKSKCKAKANFLVEQFPTMLSESKANQSPPTKTREKSPAKISSPVISIHDTESCMPIVLSPPKKPEGIIAKDIYEFDDSENTPISKAIQSPFKLAEDNDGSPKKAIIIPERPFKNIGREEQEGIKFQKPETPAINDENTTSTVTYSDRDDFVYGSISEGDDDNDIDNDNEDIKDGNMNSEESSNSSAFTAKTFENKSLIMGRIFKNAKTKPKTPVEKPKLPTPEPPKLIPKQELDRLFDTLRGLNENRQTNAVNEERLDNAPNSSRTRENQAAKRKPVAKAPKTKANTSRQCKKVSNKEDHCSKEIAQLHAELGMSPAEIAELIGEGQRKSQRRCAVNRPKKLVEIWSSDEFEEFLSTKDIIALIEEKEQKIKRKKKTTTTAAKKSTPTSTPNDTKPPDEEKASTLQSEDEKASSSPQKTLKINPKAARSKPPKGKKKGPIATANVMPPPKSTSKATKDLKSAASSRRNSIDASKTKVVASPFKKPRSVSKAAEDSESDFETELHRKTKGAPIRNRRKTISGKLENDAGSSSSGKKESGKSKIVSESVAARKSSNTKAPPADSQAKPQARRKRIASEMLYYWSSSSDEEFGLIESTHDDEDHIEESENYQQHGWIVGDSHKKLVTLLAIAKGNKKVDDCGVKETNSKKKS